MKNMGDGRRVAKVEMEVQRIVAQYLLGAIKDTYSGLVTVTRVQMPADLRTAKVYISILNPGGKEDDVLEILQDRAPEIQSAINDKLRMRYCPKLTFFKDGSMEKVLKVEGLLKDLATQRESQKQKSESEE